MSVTNSVVAIYDTHEQAEHAIKEFAALRRTIGGTSTEQGMKDYLTLLSIRQSLRMRGLGFLDFLRAGTPDLLRFAAVAP